jgi:hypothetical protein
VQALVFSCIFVALSILGELAILTGSHEDLLEILDPCCYYGCPQQLFPILLEHGFRYLLFLPLQTNKFSHSQDQSSDHNEDKGIHLYDLDHLGLVT